MYLVMEASEVCGGLSAPASGSAPTASPLTASGQAGLHQEVAAGISTDRYHHGQDARGQE